MLDAVELGGDWLRGGKDRNLGLAVGLVTSAYPPGRVDLERVTALTTVPAGRVVVAARHGMLGTSEVDAGVAVAVSLAGSAGIAVATGAWSTPYVFFARRSRSSATGCPRSTTRCSAS